MKFLQPVVLSLAVLLTSSLASAQEKKAAAEKAKKAKPAEKADKPASKKPTDARKKDAKKAEADPLAGWWTGTWLSHMNNHTGPINGHFTKLDDDNYCVHFNGMFWEVFPFEYNVVLTVTERKKDSVTMSGSQSLGLLFGNFSYEADVTDKEFSATFKSALDWGVFNMTKWEPEKEEKAEAKKVEAKKAEAKKAEAKKESSKKPADGKK